MLRRNPLIGLEVTTAETILRPLVGRADISSLTQFPDGLSNSNYLVSLYDGTELVIRIWTSGEARKQSELSALSQLKKNFPVPALLSSDHDSEFGFSVGVFERVRGKPLKSVLPLCDESQARQAGRAVGESLASLQQQSLYVEIPSFSSSTAIEYMRTGFDDPKIFKAIGSPRRNALHAMIDSYEDWLIDVGGPPKFAHGDFKSDNILLCQEGGRWKLAGVVDWEWVHAGTTFADVATLLRDDRAYASPFTKGFSEAYRHAGGWLPKGWKRAARLFDLVNQCERLSWSGDRPSMFMKALRYVDLTLREVASVPRVD